MACPYFEPVEPQGGARRPQDTMLPLGRCWGGVCRSDPELPHIPSSQTLRSYCNLGYARDDCPRFPAAAVGDAVRFSIMGDAGGRIRLYHVVEHDHLPLMHGPLEFAADTGAIEGAAQAGVALQALAYVRSYLDQRAAISRR